MAWRRFLSLVAVGSVAVTQAQEPSVASVEHRLRGTLESVRTWMDQDPSGRTAQIGLTRARLVTSVVQPYFYADGGALHEPSAARDRRIREIEELLKPYETILVELMRVSRSDNEAPNAAAQLAAFLPASESLHTSLLDIARDPATDAAKAADAYDTVFMLGLDDAELRSEVATLAKARKGLSQESDLAVVVTLRACQRWALAEMEPLLEEIITKPFIPANFPERGGRLDLVGDYLLAAEGLSRFGILAEKYLAEIRARQGELDLDDPDEALTIRRLSDCAERLEGSRIPELALTWKGESLGVSEGAFAAWKARQQDRRETPNAPVGDSRTAVSPTEHHGDVSPASPGQHPSRD